MERLTLSNYDKFLPVHVSSKLKTIIQKLQSQVFLDSAITSWVPHLIQKAIAFHVLHEHGGLLINEEIIITEDFSWLEKIDS